MIYLEKHCNAVCAICIDEFSNTKNNNVEDKIQRASGMKLSSRILNCGTISYLSSPFLICLHQVLSVSFFAVGEPLETISPGFLSVLSSLL